MAPAATAWLIRHARAEGGSPGGDAARRLTPEGRAAFEAALHRLGGRLAPTRILSSPYRRTLETAALLSAARGGVEVEAEPRLASGAATGAELLRLLAEAGPGAALVGHNPEVAEAIALAGAEAAEVPPGTVAALDADGRLLWLE